jgi:hypothetical protein
LSKREVDAIEKILIDPENSQRTPEEVAELVLQALEGTVKALRAEEVERVADRVLEAIADGRADKIPARILDAIDSRRAKTHRMAVVGQIQYEPQGPVHTVVLGPFSAQGYLDSQEKFLKATEGGCAARTVGQDLAWDTKTKKGRGRFMLAPAFFKPRDAWDFFRGAGPAEAVAEAVTRIPREIGPVCMCGLKHTPACRWCGGDIEHFCAQHDSGAAGHSCRDAA